jgi:hypothetical protein
MDRAASAETARKVALVLDALTAVPWFLVAPVVRPWHLRWGSTAAEVRGSMPGDEVVRRAQFIATRAVTVDAPPDQVWPWIVQLGYGRAGFYTYDLIDNAGQPSAERILDQFQHPVAGDLMPMYEELHGLAIAYTVTAFEKDEWLVWVHRPTPAEEPDSTWTWRLSPLPGGRTRLVTRMKQDYRWETPGLAFFNFVLMEMGDFAMERRMLKGIKARAESAARPQAGLGLAHVKWRDAGAGIAAI